jgi:large subunit ribosomal protein L24
MDIRKGSTVVVLAGKDRGKTGTVERVLRDANKVVVGGLNIMKRHMKPNKKYPSGGIVEISYPLHQSNVKVVDATEEKPKTSTKGKK